MVNYNINISGDLSVNNIITSDISINNLLKQQVH